MEPGNMEKTGLILLIHCYICLLLNKMYLFQVKAFIENLLLAFSLDFIMYQMIHFCELLLVL